MQTNWKLWGGMAGPCDGSQLNRPVPPPNKPAPAGQGNPNGGWPPGGKPVWALPEIAICRARRKVKGGLAYCRMTNAYTCRYVTRVDYDLICCHPKRDEIVARTEAKQN
jgi:hypothetical protein